MKHKIKWKNVIPVLKDQMPLSRFFKNFFITRNAWGLFHQSSHVSSVSGAPKVMYNRKKTALSAAEQMMNKTENKFAAYKCLYCSGYHIGKTKR